MTADGRRWRRVDAEHWIHRLGMLQTAVALIGTAGAVLLIGWMTAAWRRDERWAWPAWVLISGSGTILAAARLVDGGLSWLGGAGVLVAALMLVLLMHPDARARWVTPHVVGGSSRTRWGDDTRAGAGGGGARDS
jgi:hypothetical protein